MSAAVMMGEADQGRRACGLLLLLVLSTLSCLPPPVLSQEAVQRVTGIRLSGGQGPYQGNVEVEVDGVWGFVCDDNFGFDEADVMCRELGYDMAETFTRNNHFGDNTAAWRRSSVKFWLSEVNCSEAASFSECDSAPLGQHQCGPTEIAGVSCRDVGSQCEEAQMFPCGAGNTCIPRQSVCNNVTDCSDGSDEADTLCNDVGVTRLTSNLANDNIPGAALGVVFVKRWGEWGTVCDNDFDNDDAKVVCRSLGYEGGWSIAFTRGYLGVGSEEHPVWIKSPGCRGSEESIDQCPVQNSDSFLPCVHIKDSSVFCYDKEVDVRVSGGDYGVGAVEMRLGGKWGAVCDSRFDDFDAQVVCKMLGYNGDDSKAYKQAGSSAGNVWQMNLDCLGHEEHVQQCRLRFSNDTCRTTAGVVCSSTSGGVDSGLQSLLPTQCGDAEDASTKFLTRLARVRSGAIPSRFDHPWLVSLRAEKYGIRPRGRLQCGGTIISEYYIVTAAHCLDLLGSLLLVVRVGDFNSDFKEESEEEYLIDKIWKHEEYDLHSFNDNDIALLKVQAKNGRGIRFGPQVKPLCLPRVGDNYEDLQNCSIVGWGHSSSAGQYSSRPNAAKVVIKPDLECERSFVENTNNVTSSNVCVAGGLLVNVCKGDSGGPLACTRPGEKKKSLYGIASFGLLCKLSIAPDIFTRVTKYLRWIHDIIAQNS